MRSGWNGSDRARSTSPEGRAGRLPVSSAGFGRIEPREPLPALGLDLGPGVLQGHGAVEHAGARRRVRVHREVPESLELEDLAGARVRERRLDVAAHDPLRL